MTNIMISIDDETNEIKKKLSPILKSYGSSISNLCALAIIQEWNKQNPSTSNIDKIKKQIIDIQARQLALAAETEIINKELLSLQDQLSKEQEIAAMQEIKVKEEEATKYKKLKNEQQNKNIERKAKLEKYIKICKDKYALDQCEDWLEQIKNYEAELKTLIL